MAENRRYDRECKAQAAKEPGTSKNAMYVWTGGQPSEVGKNKRMKLLAIKIKDSQLKANALLLQSLACQQARLA
ncbi:MAG: hypothetical protein HFH61_02725 [Lachnospiraceae bacterium]|nr:hypothetical protein [Lachnospiraceae bacterium]